MHGKIIQISPALASPSVLPTKGPDGEQTCGYSERQSQRDE